MSKERRCNTLIFKKLKTSFLQCRWKDTTKVRQFVKSREGIVNYTTGRQNWRMIDKKCREASWLVHSDLK